MSAVSYYTVEGLQKLKDELEQMKTIERSKISAQIAEARDKGDLSENAEYDAAKEAQGMLEMKISKLEDVLANARILNEENIDLTKVGVLTKVKLKNMANSTIIEYSLVAEKRLILEKIKYQFLAPLAKAYWGKKLEK